MNDASFSFDATSYVGYIYATYTGYDESFVSAKLTVKVEKRFLLVFWNEVGTWTATSTDIDGTFYYEMPLDRCYPSEALLQSSVLQLFPYPWEVVMS